MPKRAQEPTPNDAELEKALPDLVYVGVQCAIWHLARGAVLSSFANDDLLRRTLENSLVESALLFVRKTIEFFKSEEPKSDFTDNIYAYRFKGYVGSKLSPIDLKTLHKRVGHVSIVEIRSGKMDWPLDEWVSFCLDKWIDFFRQLSVIPSALDPQRAERCNQNVSRLQRMKELVGSAAS